MGKLEVFLLAQFDFLVGRVGTCNSGQISDFPSKNALAGNYPRSNVSDEVFYAA